MEIRPQTIDNLLKVLAWVIFLGLCIETGAVLFNFMYSAFNPTASHNLYKGFDLSQLRAENAFQYWAVGSLIVSVLALKAYVFYLVIQTMQLMPATRPFSEPVGKGIHMISYFALFAGLLGLVSQGYIDRLERHGFDLSGTGAFLNDSKAMLLMAAVVFFIARIFQKGIDLQTENDLTV